MLNSKAPTCCRIFLVDDHPVVRSGLKAFWEQESDFKVCGEFSNPREALAAVTKSSPDLTLVDIGLGESSGLDLISNMRNYCEKTLLLALSMYDETLYAERALTVT